MSVPDKPNLASPSVLKLGEPIPGLKIAVPVDGQSARLLVKGLEDKRNKGRGPRPIEPTSAPSDS